MSCDLEEARGALATLEARIRDLRCAYRRMLLAGDAQPGEIEAARELLDLWRARLAEGREDIAALERRQRGAP